MTLVLKSASKGRKCSFRFANSDLNFRLVLLLNQNEIPFKISKQGVISFRERDRAFVENELIRQVRASVFPAWQVVTCPMSWVRQYKDYMERRQIPFEEEFDDSQHWFLIPARYRPHSWKVEQPPK